MEKMIFLTSFEYFLENTFRMVKKFNFQLHFLVRPNVFSPLYVQLCFKRNMGFWWPQTSMPRMFSGFMFLVNLNVDK
jgi:hypothetical protein